MHQLRYDDSLGDDVAAMLAFVGLHFLAAVAVVGFANGLRLDELQGVGTAFRAGRELVVMPTVFLHHDNVTTGTTIRRELQGLCPVLGKMVLRQAEHAVFPHHPTTAGTTAVVALLHFFL